MRGYEADMTAPVLPSELAEVKRQEDRLRALARGDFTALDGGGHGAG